MGVEKDGIMKKGMGFLCKVVCFAVVHLCAGNLSAAPAVAGPVGT